MTLLCHSTDHGKKVNKIRGFSGHRELQAYTFSLILKTDISMLSPYFYKKPL